MSDRDIIFILTKEDVIECARQMDIPLEKITDDVLYQVKKGVEFGLESWAEVMMTTIDLAVNG